jgi:two-component system response regulator NreC
VLILDLNMPGDPSLPAIPNVSEESPGTRVVVLTMQADPAFAREAMQAGASGYVLKEAADEELVQLSAPPRRAGPTSIRRSVPGSPRRRPSRPGRRTI